jgi:hypothetical protein
MFVRSMQGYRICRFRTKTNCGAQRSDCGAIAEQLRQAATRDRDDACGIGRAVHWVVAQRPLTKGFDPSALPARRLLAAARKIPQWVTRRRYPRIPGPDNENALIIYRSRVGNRLCCPRPIERHGRSTNSHQRNPPWRMPMRRKAAWLGSKPPRVIILGSPWRLRASRKKALVAVTSRVRLR